MGSYRADVCSNVHFYDHFGFNSFFDAIKMGWIVMIDGWALLTIGPVCSWGQELVTCAGQWEKVAM